MLTGFSKINDNEVAQANAKTTLKTSISPFKHGVKFTISGFAYVKAEIDGKVDSNGRNLPVLVTSVGNLFLSMLRKSKVDSKGNILTPKGQLTTLVEEKISTLNTDGEILQAIVDACKGKTLICKQTMFATILKDGRTVPSSLTEVDFVD